MLSQSDIKEAFETAPEVLNVIRKQAVAAAGQRDRARQLGTAVGGGGDGGRPSSLDASQFSSDPKVVPIPLWS